MFCTYCSHALNKHEPSAVGVECLLCKAVCGDFERRARTQKKTKKEVFSMLRYIKDNWL